MNSLSYIRGRRLWVIRDFMVWGLAEDARLYYLGVEAVTGEARLVFGTAGMGGAEQYVAFADLCDFRGNSLPDTVADPKVLICPRACRQAYLVGEEAAGGFKIARDPGAAGPVPVNLFIYEMG